MVYVRDLGEGWLSLYGASTQPLARLGWTFLGSVTEPKGRKRNAQSVAGLATGERYCRS